MEHDILEISAGDLQGRRRWAWNGVFGLENRVKDSKIRYAEYAERVLRTAKVRA